MFEFIKRLFKGKNKSEAQSEQNVNMAEEKVENANEADLTPIETLEEKTEVESATTENKAENEIEETETTDADKKLSPYGKFCIKIASDGTYMFNLKASNGSIIATSQTYTSKSSCLNGIQSIKNNAPIASIEDQSLEGAEIQTHPKFEIFVDKGGSYRFRLKATNGNIIAASQGYSSKSKCKNGIESIKRHAELATIIEEEK